jgi:hypothetical protein
MTKLAMPDSNYDRDFYAWANEQAALLRAGKLGQADLAHIAEEIESMGKTEKRELVSRLTVLLLHLLKWRFQPEFRSTSWRLSVEEQRIQVASHLVDNPSLKVLLATALADSYRLAVIGARRETGLGAEAFPARCPWSFDQMMNDDFWPD